MKSFQSVRGTQSDILEIEVNVDTVYVRSNIERIETEEFTGWQYDEVQYDVKEYIELIANENKDLKARQDTTESALLDILILGGM